MRVLPLVLSAAAALALTTGLASAQSAPGTVVSNSIDLSYVSGGSTITVPSAATATFTVDRKIDLNVDALDGGALVYAEQGADDAVLNFLVENLGNGTQGFDIGITTAGTLGLTYATTAGAEGTYWVTISTSPTPGAATETLYNVNGTRNAGDLPAGGRYYVHLYANVATSATSGQTRSFDVIARALDAGTATITAEVRGQGAGGIDTVFADPGADGRELATESLTINAPDLSATKSVAVVSENLNGNFNCATGAPVPGSEAAIPGACLEYTITVTNGAGATNAARNLVITDALPGEVTYVALNAGTFTTVTRSGRTVTGNLTTLAPGSTASFTIRATVGN